MPWEVPSLMTFPLGPTKPRAQSSRPFDRQRLDRSLRASAHTAGHWQPAPTCVREIDRMQFATSGSCVRSPPPTASGLAGSCQLGVHHRRGLGLWTKWFRSISPTQSAPEPATVTSRRQPRRVDRNQDRARRVTGSWGTRPRCHLCRCATAQGSVKQTCRPHDEHDPAADKSPGWAVGRGPRTHPSKSTRGPTRRPVSRRSQRFA